MFGIRRRAFLAALGGVATWPLATRAQQRTAMRRIGWLVTDTADNRQGQGNNAAFLQELERLGWTVGRNVHIDYRWGANDADRRRRGATELVALAPDVIL